MEKRKAANLKQCKGHDLAITADVFLICFKNWKNETAHITVHADELISKELTTMNDC